MGKKDRRDVKKELIEERAETFFEAIPVAGTMPKELVLPRINLKMAEFVESVVIFTAGTVEVLLLMRIVLMLVGIKGGNLLTYLLYAVSYPFLMVINTGQSQVPDMANKDLYENIVLFLIYLVGFYGAFRLINAFKNNK